MIINCLPTMDTKYNLIQIIGNLNSLFVLVEIHQKSTCFKFIYHCTLLRNYAKIIQLSLTEYFFFIIHRITN